jgi:hypothetical protein
MEAPYRIDIGGRISREDLGTLLGVAGGLGFGFNWGEPPVEDSEIDVEYVEVEIAGKAALSLYDDGREFEPSEVFEICRQKGLPYRSEDRGSGWVTWWSPGMDHPAGVLDREDGPQVPLAAVAAAMSEANPLASLRRLIDQHTPPELPQIEVA